MNTINSLNESSLTFTIKNSKDIKEIVEFVRIIAKKASCSESAIILISTALSEVCRKFLKHSGSLDLAISIFSGSNTIEFQGKASAKGTFLNIDWNSEMYSLKTYFDSSVIQEDDDPTSVTYSFEKVIPHKKIKQTKMENGKKLRL